MQTTQPLDRCLEPFFCSFCVGARAGMLNSFFSQPRTIYVLSSFHCRLLFPQARRYDFSGYRRLAEVVDSFGLRLQCVLSFHACGTSRFPSSPRLASYKASLSLLSVVFSSRISRLRASQIRPSLPRIRSSSPPRLQAPAWATRCRCPSRPGSSKWARAIPTSSSATGPSTYPPVACPCPHTRPAKPRRLWALRALRWKGTGAACAARASSGRSKRR